MDSIVIDKEIDRLIQFAKQQGMLGEWDDIPARNALMDLFEVQEPYAGELEPETLETAVPILENMLDYAAEQGLIPENTMTHRDLFDAKIMGLLMPRQSEVARAFRETAKHESIEKATDAFYKLSRSSNYIMTERIKKNQFWLAPTDFGDLEITINLSKPEKDPKEIAAVKNAPQRNYPKCLLCLENVGYAGRMNHPARQNHRVIPLTLTGETWFFQYSPYVYYDEHSIIFKKEHSPMQIQTKTFERLLDFVDRFPHYFIGSNADLPIVGGSILNHDHFQGGRYVFPMEKAECDTALNHPDFPGIRAGLVRWPMSVLRLTGSEVAPLVRLADHVLRTWRDYSDPDADLLAYSDAAGERTPHNTITPIARRTKDGRYELDLVLRNNRTSPEHPGGIFHPHEELHHIKKENIGLIEVMGLAVLPGRLREELSQLRDVLTGKVGLEDVGKSSTAMDKHMPWLRELAERHGTSMKESEAEMLLKTETGRKFAEVLSHAGVFKRDAKGTAAFHKFTETAGFTKI